ncbi:CcdC family protein [Listeria valentina]|uniref:CcdC family protein n=1 Tax=Listeria valentina TaxID=2705293 RepID=UPI0014314C15|nr:CcdC protein domain-containing protein [Listeria valentina]
MSLFISILITLLFGTMIIVIRMKASKRPASIKGIILPPIMMSTGALMFVIPYFWVTGVDILEAIGMGLVFSLILIWTTRFEVRNEEVYIKRTKSFPILLMALLLIRIILKYWISGSVEVGELAGMFWIMAFAMIVPWRVAMYFQYKAVARGLAKSAEMSERRLKDNL